MQNKRSLLIGANSRLVRAILPLLNNVDAISHRDVPQADLAQYGHIFLFSWSHRSLEENLALAGALPLERTIFISTTAVYALQYRAQWNRYPRDKALVEQFVLDRGGSVARLGVTDPALKAKHLGAFPFTAPEMLAKAIESWPVEGRRVVDLTIIAQGTLAGWRRIWCRTLLAISNFLPSHAVAQIPVQGLAKVSGLKTYGYAADAMRFYSMETLVGHGVLGSRYARKRQRRIDLNILVSPEPDRALLSDGFQNTLIGRNKTGLARLWHGVSTAPVQQLPGLARKRVPLFVSRPRAPRRSYQTNVESLHDTGAYWRVATQRDGQGALFFCRSITLAAGPLENTRLISCLTATPCHLSDHEIGMIGSCSLDAAISAQAVGRLGPFIIRRFTLSRAAQRPTLLDVRPYVPEKHGKDAAFYIDSTVSIVAKLARGLTWARINEALFNKFGVALATPRCSVFAQVLAHDAISVQPISATECSLTRKRLSAKDWQIVREDARCVLPDLDSGSDVVSIDGQHIMGGTALATQELIQSLTAQGRLRILGSPTRLTLDAFHHTARLAAMVAPND